MQLCEERLMPSCFQKNNNWRPKFTGLLRKDLVQLKLVSLQGENVKKQTSKEKQAEKSRLDFAE